MAIELVLSNPRRLQIPSTDMSPPYLTVLLATYYVAPTTGVAARRKCKTRCASRHARRGLQRELRFCITLPRDLLEAPYFSVPPQHDVSESESRTTTVSLTMTRHPENNLKGSQIRMPCDVPSSIILLSWILVVTLGPW